jgi:hypothetical protein
MSVQLYLYLANRSDTELRPDRREVEARPPLSARRDIAVEDISHS